MVRALDCEINGVQICLFRLESWIITYKNNVVVDEKFTVRFSVELDSLTGDVKIASGSVAFDNEVINDAFAPKFYGAKLTVTRLIFNKSSNG